MQSISTTIADVRIGLSSAWVGASSITIQLLALRHLNQLFGISSASIAVALAVALAGLAFGAWFWSRPGKADSRRIGIAQLFIWSGVFSSTCIWAPSLCDDVLLPIYRGLNTNSWVVQVGRIAFGSSLIFPTCAMLGGVVPRMASLGKLQPTQQTLVDQRLSRLYSLETLGAAAGGLVVGAWSVQLLGLSWTSAVTSMGCLLFAVFWFSVDPVDCHHNKDTQDTTLPKPYAPRASGWLVAICLAGCASVAMEIVWVRMLVPVIGSDSFSYGLVSASYLVGIGFGAFLTSLLPGQIAATPRRFAFMQIALACASIVQMQIFVRIANGEVNKWLDEAASGALGPLLGRVVLCLCLLSASTILIGSSFAVAARGYVTADGGGHSRAGSLYACLTTGNVLGVLLTGLFIIPYAGLQKTLWVLAGVALLAGWVAYGFSEECATRSSSSKRARETKRRPLLLPASLGLGSCSVLLGFYLPITPIGIDAQVSTQGLHYYGEGPVATVAVVQSGDGLSKRMVVDGIIIGESHWGVDEKQQMLSAFPALLGSSKSNQSVLTIGLGTGILAGKLAEHECVEQVTCIEFAPAVIQAAEEFKDANADVLRHPRVQLVQADGLQYLRHSPNKYHAILSDAKSRPGHSANAAFFSTDYYQLCDSRLTHDGLFAQWISLDASLDEIKIILHTFTQTFQHGFVGIAAPDSLYLIGTHRAKLQIDEARINKYLASPQAKDLRVYGWADAADISSMLWVPSHEVQSWLHSSTEINTLDRPVLEACALQVMAQSTQSLKTNNLRQLALWLEGAPELKTRLEDSPPAINTDVVKRRTATELILASIALTKKGDNWLSDATERFQRARQWTPGLNRQVLVAREWTEIAGTANSEQKMLEAYSEAARLMPDHPEFQHQLAWLMKRSNLLEGSIDHFYRAHRLEPENIIYKTDFAIALAALGKMSLARQYLAEVLEAEPLHAAAQYGYGIVLWSQGNIEKSVNHLKNAIRLDPSFASEVDRLGISL